MQGQPLSIQYHALPLALRIPHSQLVINLPYAEPVSKKEMKEMAPLVQKLIRQEMKKSSPRDYLSELETHHSHYFDRPDVLAELERVKNQESIVFNNQKYEQVQEPQKKDNLNAWQQSVNQAHRNLPNSETRLVNLELMKMYGEAQWKDRVEQLETWLQQTQATNKRIKDQNQKCNQRRKFRQQEQIKPQLTQLKTDIAEQVKKNRKLEEVCREMEEELLVRDALMKKKVKRNNVREQNDLIYALRLTSHFQAQFPFPYSACCLSTKYLLALTHFESAHQEARIVLSGAKGSLSLELSIVEQSQPQAQLVNQFQVLSVTEQRLVLDFLSQLLFSGLEAASHSYRMDFPLGFDNSGVTSYQRVPGAWQQ